ncbi:hypothetical protein CSKR_100335 [Clonorchis sinensis]|uniref:Uncharacterized protein n=1 Tax=Clonorchis sinensis TaxID=79923 RepID=A0A419PDL1_CLOSI|nr:hypothetical protein CSKR_100335 [Clonorchis sinensis]
MVLRQRSISFENLCHAVDDVDYSCPLDPGKSDTEPVNMSWRLTTRLLSISVYAAFVSKRKDDKADPIPDGQKLTSCLLPPRSRERAKQQSPRLVALLNLWHQSKLAIVLKPLLSKSRKYHGSAVPVGHISQHCSRQFRAAS